MLLSERLIHTSLVLLAFLAFFLLLHLFVKLLSDQSASLLHTGHSLLLFLVVKERVELLNGGPLILLGQLRIHFCSGGNAGRN